ncbi:MAG: TlpA family protein disulfide reductase [Spirochaetaceae bacterium]|nr:TlpA family protein disulfide reductase [Spirochaetaceae bacterium]
MRKVKLFVLILASFIIISATLFAFAVPKKQKQQNNSIEAPNFTVQMSDGTEASLSDFRGKPVLLHFWATWCPPCVEELPLIAQLAQDRAEEIRVFAISLGEDVKTVQTYLSSKEGALKKLVSGCDANGLVASMYGVSAVPCTLFIDEDGKVLFGQVGAFSQESLEAALEKALLY